jgi:hypothetical protein
LKGGLKLGQKVFTGDEIILHSNAGTSDDIKDVVKIFIVPSSWTLSRKFEFKEEGDKQVMIPPPLDIPPVFTTTNELTPNTWKIELSWSREAIEQAAFEMTYWYMSKVGASIFKNIPLPKGWEDMSPEEAGYNAIRMMLYYTPLRPISRLVETKATKLYNVYCFGYPIGVDSKSMLWTEDLGQ